MEVRKAFILDSADPLSKATGHLGDDGAVIVTKNGKYYGVVDQNSLSKGMRDMQSIRCETVVVKPPVLSSSSNLMEQTSAFLEGHFKALPVVDAQDAPLGLATRIGVLSELSNSQLIPTQKVSEMMSSPAYTITEADSIAKARALLKSTDSHRLVVINSAGFPCGVISELDINSWDSKATTASGRKDMIGDGNSKFNDMHISEFLNPDVATVAHSSALNEAVTKMVKNKVSSLVVLSDAKKPVGVLSALDVFRFIQTVAKPKQQVNISGLSATTKAYHDIIEEKVSHVIDKFGKSFTIQNVGVHVKENKSSFTLSLTLETAENGLISIKHERPDLKEVIDEATFELSQILRKAKEKNNPKLGGRRGAEVE